MELANLQFELDIKSDPIEENRMKKEAMKRMLFVLGKEHCLDVLINVYKNDWQTASEVARDLNIHIATAVKYLTELYELDLVNRRVKRGKTREAYEYQVKNPKVKIEFDINTLMSQTIKVENKPVILFAILYTIFLKSRKVVGQSVDAYVNGKFKSLQNDEKYVVMNSLMVDGDLEDAKSFFVENLETPTITDQKCDDMIAALSALINGIIDLYESRLGHHSTESLIDVTMRKVIDTFGNEIIIDASILSKLPYDYFGKWSA